MDAAPAHGAAAGQAAGERDARRLGLGLFLVSAAQFTLQLDFSIVNVALATIQREFGVSAVDLQWIVTGYALPFGALLLLGGRLGDLTGHRRLLVGGLGLFGVTSLLAGLAPDSGVLIAARFAQGASAALVAPMALAAITDLFPDGPGRARARDAPAEPAEAALRRQPLQWHLIVTVAQPGDPTNDATVAWPADREDERVLALLPRSRTSNLSLCSRPRKPSTSSHIQHLTPFTDSSLHRPPNNHFRPLPRCILRLRFTLKHKIHLDRLSLCSLLNSLHASLRLNGKCFR